MAVMGKFVFLVIAIVAAIFGFGLISGTSLTMQVVVGYYFLGYYSLSQFIGLHIIRMPEYAYRLI